MSKQLIFAILVPSPDKYRTHIGTPAPIPFPGERALPSWSYWQEQEDADPNPEPNAETQLIRFLIPSHCRDLKAADPGPRPSNNMKRNKVPVPVPLMVEGKDQFSQGHGKNIIKLCLLSVMVEST